LGWVGPFCWHNAGKSKVARLEQKGSEHSSAEIESSNPGRRWVVRLFGGVSVEAPGAVIDRFATRRSALLLIRLCLAQGRSVSRDSLCNDLWTDDYLDAARPRLRQEFARLNAALGPAQGVVSADRISAKVDVTVADIDLSFAEQLLARVAAEVDLKRKSELFDELAAIQGEIAPGYDEPWIEEVRADWRSRASRLLMKAAQICAADGENERAATLGKKAAFTNLLSETVQESYLRLLVDLERTGEAKRHQLELDRVYQDVLGTGPTNRLRRSLGPEIVKTMPDRSEATQPVTRRLAASLTELLGREPEIEQVVAALGPEKPLRLYTLCGPGGIGKTALAMEVARQLFDIYSGRVWFVALASVETPRFIAHEIQQALRITTSEEDPLQAVTSSLSGEPALLVLDNFEQLVDGGAQIARKLLENCGNLKLLVTTRRKLKIEGELEFSVPVLDPESASDLFWRTARRARPSLSTNPVDHESVRRIVALLDNLPLAIHLAASRANVVSLPNMEDELSRRLDLLVSRKSDIEPRHRTLRQTIAWSFEQLKPEVGQFLLDLSIFRGGWTVSLVQEVLERSDSLDLIEELCENSLVYEVPTEDEMRFNMLLPIRQFAEERQDSVRTKAQLRRLVSSLSRWCSVAKANLLLEDQIRWYDRLEREHENLRRVLQFAAGEASDLGVGLCANLWRFWSVKGHQKEASSWFELLLPEDPVPSQDLVNALFGAAICAFEQSDLKSTEALFMRCRKASLKAGLQNWPCAIDCNMAEIVIARGKHQQAVPILEQVLIEVKRTGDAYLEGISQDMLASVLITLGDFEGAQEYIASSLSLLTRYQDRLAIASATMTLGRLYMKTGRGSEAQEIFQAQNDLFEQFGCSPGVGRALQNMAELALIEGRLDDVERFCAESALKRTAIGDRIGMGHLSLILAEVAKRRRDSAAATRHLAEARRILRACDCEGLIHANLYSGDK
jgi:predicted ATPase/DNA-binding SARP family transcriptional activator